MTRPEPGARETADRLNAMGFTPVLAPAMRIRAKPANLPDPTRLGAVLVTSGQAVPALPVSYRGITLFAVGDATAARARQCGFTHVISAGGDSTDLTATVGGAIAPGATLLLATGQGLGRGVAASLRAAGFAVIRRSVYARTAVRRLPFAALRALRSGSLRAALFFSADSASGFIALIEAAALHETVANADAVAISQPAAVALERLPWRRILVAARPNQDAMLALLK